MMIHDSSLPANVFDVFVQLKLVEQADVLQCFFPQLVALLIRVQETSSVVLARSLRKVLLNDLLDLGV